MRRSEYENLTKSFTITGTIFKKAIVFRAFIRRSNIHAELHFTEVV